MRWLRIGSLLLTLTLPCCMTGESLASSTEGAPDQTARGLTAVAGVEVGHHTLSVRPTGCTVVLVTGGATGGVDVRGGAPATRETDLLRPENLVQEVHAVVLSGGSAFGLDSAGGVMRYLEEKGIGFPVRGTVVPIVVGASLLDLGIGGNQKPDADCGYRAAKAASGGPIAEGNVGAGAGATVGKSRGLEHAMKGGLGTAEIRVEGGLVVAALVAVNAAGDVIDRHTGEVVAGVRGENGELLDARRLLRSGAWPRRSPSQEPAEARANTTLAVVATNARLTKAQATKVAQMAQDGLARSIFPAHTPGDGDTVFVLATGDLESEADVAQVGALAAEAVSDAIVRAVLAAESIDGYPAASDLR